MSPPDGIGPLLAVPLVALAAAGTRAVRPRAALVGALLGLALAAGLGWAGIAMLGVMLLLGTLVTARDRRGRDVVQVLCNGGVPALAAGALLLGASWGAHAAAAALAAALSDTVSGEWGARHGKRPRLLLLGAPVPPGTDGGMSLAGTLAGALAAPLVPLAGWATGAPLTAIAILWLGLAGLAGNVVDSLLGATLQPHLGPRGNDLTNLLATAVAGLGGGLLA